MKSVVKRRKRLPEITYVFWKIIILKFTPRKIARRKIEKELKHIKKELEKITIKVKKSS